MCWNDFSIKVVFYDLSYFILLKKNCLHNVDILEMFYKYRALNKIIIAEKDDFVILR